VLNQSAEYALRATMRLAHLRPGAWAQASDLAQELALPANYLSKLMHQLVAAGVLESRRGRGGGFRLRRAPDQLTLGEVVAPFDPPSRYRECFLGGKRCSAATACEVHDAWKPIADRLFEFLTETTVARMAGGDVPSPRGGRRPGRR
jgi:Rrf2 family iron-sulfur cluster assembly transcriptional regulator